MTMPEDCLNANKGSDDVANELEKVPNLEGKKSENYFSVSTLLSNLMESKENTTQCAMQYFKTKVS